MGMRAPISSSGCHPYGCTEAVSVDHMIGSAYTTVRSVAENIEYIKHVSYHMPQVFMVEGELENIAAVSTVVDDIASLADNLDAAQLLKNNLTATRAPLPTDDETQGYAVGSRWLWQGQEWVRTDSEWLPMASVASYAPFASYDAANAATKLPEQGRISAIVNGQIVEWVRDPAGTCLGGGWEPAWDITPEHFGQTGTDDDSAAIRAAETLALSRKLPVVFRGSYTSSLNLLGLTQKVGGGTISTPARLERADDGDVLRYQPGTDRSVRISRNRSDINPDNGYYFLQQYSSIEEYTLRGYAANIRRTGGEEKVVAAQLNGFNVGSGSGTVWGIACEAWTGNSTTPGTGKSTLIGIEPAVLSQTHDNSKIKIGVDSVFKNRPDSAPDVLYGSAGENRFNQASTAFRISNGFNSSRPPSGAFNGWAWGVRFTSNSLDESVDGKAIGFDISEVNPAILRAALKLSTGQWIVLGNSPSGRDDGIRHALSPGRRIEFARDTNTAPVVRSWVDLSLEGPSGTIMAFHGVANTAYAGTVGAMPAQPAMYLAVRIENTVYRIPAFHSTVQTP